MLKHQVWTGSFLLQIFVNFFLSDFIFFFRETNLKIRQGIQETSDIRNLETVSQLKGLNFFFFLISILGYTFLYKKKINFEFKGEFSYEGPNNRLYMFDGTLKLDQGQPIPVGPNQILLRVKFQTNFLIIFNFTLLMLLLE